MIAPFKLLQNSSLFYHDITNKKYVMFFFFVFISMLQAFLLASQIAVKTKPTATAPGSGVPVSVSSLT